MLKRLVAPIIALLLTACAAAAPPPVTASVPLPELRRGMNVLGYDPIWTDPSKGRFEARHFEEIRRGGFDFVRVNLHGFKHMDAQDRLSPAFFSRLDWIVGHAT